MSLTVGQLERDVSTVLYGAKLEAQDFVQLVNEAGQALMTLHDWEWAKGREAEIVLTPDQDLAPLPWDCAEIVSLRRPGNYLRRVEFVSLEQIHNMKGITEVSTGWYWAALRWVPVEGDPSKEPRPHLYLYPTPQNADTFTLLYRADWPQLRDDNDVVPLPTWMHTLYRAIFRGMVAGYEEHESGTVDQRLDAVRASALFLTTQHRDASVAHTVGPVRGGYAKPGRHSHGDGAARPWPTRYEYHRGDGL